MSERDERLYLDDIAQAIERILSYTVEGRAAFFADSRTQDAVIRNLEVIGEAVRADGKPIPAPRYRAPRRRTA